MVIKVAKNKCVKVSALLILFVTNILIASHNSRTHTISKENATISATSSEPEPAVLELPDKVYSFIAPSDVLEFESVYLEGDYMYYFTIEIVTPNNCLAKILVQDPEACQFDIFEANLDYNVDYMRYYRVPFGTAQSGNYYFQIYIESGSNFNLYIKIEQGLKCLYDKMSVDESNNLAYYNVNKFYNGKHVEHDIELNSDWMYKFFVGRVSAISIEYSNDVFIDLELEDPNGLLYYIYSNALLSPADQINSFRFGTAIDGVYTIKLTVRCEASYVNLAYAVADMYKISKEIIANDTEEPSDDQEGDGIDILAEISNITLLPLPYFTALIVAVCGSIVGIVILVSKIKKKNSIELDVKNRQKSKR